MDSLSKPVVGSFSCASLIVLQAAKLNRKLKHSSSEQIYRQSFDSFVMVTPIFDPNAILTSLQRSVRPQSCQDPLLSVGRSELARGFSGFSGQLVYKDRPMVVEIPSLKLQPIPGSPTNGWLEDERFLFGARPIFRCELLVSGRVYHRWLCIDQSERLRPLRLIWWKWLPVW